jgi:hypothetical protein
MDTIACLRTMAQDQAERPGQPDRSSLLFDGITTHRELLLLPIVDREPSRANDHIDTG